MDDIKREMIREEFIGKAIEPPPPVLTSENLAVFIRKVKNGFYITIGNNEYIARNRWDIKDVIEKHLPEDDRGY